MKSYFPSKPLPPESHLRTRKMPQAGYKPLIFNRFPIHAVRLGTCAIHLRQPNLPRWISIQLQEGTEDKEQIWLGFEHYVGAGVEGFCGGIGDLCVHEFRRNIFR